MTDEISYSQLSLFQGRKRRIFIKGILNKRLMKTKDLILLLYHQLKVSIHNQTEGSIFLPALQMGENLF